MITNAYGLKTPENGDKSSLWFPAIAANFTQLDGHSHQGTDSAQLSNASILSNAAITRSKLASGTAYRVLANSSAGVMSENAALTNHRVIVADTNGQLANNAALTATHVVYADANGELAGEATLAISRGGTNIATYTRGNILYCSATNVLSKLAIGSSGQVLKSDGTDVSWGSSAATLVPQTKSAGYVILNTDDVITGDTDSAGFTLTLPDCATNSGKVFKIKKVGTGFTTAKALTVARAGSDTIFDTASGGTSTTLNTPGEEIEIVSFGSTVWQVINRRIPSLEVAYTPTVAGLGTVSGVSFFWKRIGNSVFVRGYLVQGTVSGAVIASITLPAGLTVDTTLIPGDQKSALGYSSQMTSSASPASVSVSGTPGVVHFDSAQSTSAVMLAATGASTILVDNLGSGFGNTGWGAVFNFSAPIFGWNG